MERRGLDERELRQAFHAAFDRARPGPDAPDRAFEAVAAAGARTRVLGRRLAGAAAVGLALLLVVALQLQRGGLVPRHGQPAATVTTAPSPAAAPTATAPAPPGPTAGLVNTAAPEVVAAASARVAMAAWGRSGAVAMTVDGGANWTALRPPGPPQVVFDVQFVDEDVAFVSTDLGLYRYQRSTAGWAQLAERTDLVRIDFLNRSNGFAVTAGGEVVETDDGGRHLFARDVGIHPVGWIQWVSATRAWAAGPDGIVSTGDGGATWVRQLTLPVSRAQVLSAQVGFRDEANGFAIFDAAGPDGQPAVLVYHTADGGAHWAPGSPVPAGVTHSALLVTGGAQAMLLAGGSSGGPASICATTDAGRTWSCLPTPFPAGTGALAARGGTWMLVADVSSAPLLAVSSDGGATWATRRV